MTSGRLHAQFIDGTRGRLFVTARVASERSHGVLVVPAFAEEMNKSRRMVTELAGALADRGVSTIVPDVFGTGDSEGEFGDATVEQWLADIAGATHYAGELGIEIQSVLGIRFGSLLAAELARRGTLCARRTVFWQPVIDGARMLDQFLRLRIAAQMMGDGAKESVAGLRASLKTQHVEIAGYELSAELVAGIDRLKLDADSGRALGTVDWIEVLRSADATVGAASVRAIEALRLGGCEVRLHTATGDPFWMSTEIVTSAAVVTTSLDALCRAA